MENEMHFGNADLFRASERDIIHQAEQESRQDADEEVDEEELLDINFGTLDGEDILSHSYNEIDNQEADSVISNLLEEIVHEESLFSQSQELSESQDYNTGVAGVEYQQSQLELPTSQM
jgi:hypothetical protein